MNPVVIKDLLNDFIDFFFIEKSKCLFICLRIRPISWNIYRLLLLSVNVIKSKKFYTTHRTKLFHYKMTLHFLYKFYYNQRTIVLIFLICISAINIHRISILIYEQCWCCLFR